MSYGGPGLGGGSFFGNAGPSGPYGAYPACGCSSFILVIAGLMIAFVGCSQMIGGR
jgi:hypothetical protein